MADTVLSADASESPSRDDRKNRTSPTACSQFAIARDDVQHDATGHGLGGGRDVQGLGGGREARRPVVPVESRPARDTAPLTSARRPSEKASTRCVPRSGAS